MTNIWRDPWCIAIEAYNLDPQGWDEGLAEVIKNGVPRAAWSARLYRIWIVSRWRPVIRQSYLDSEVTEGTDV